MAIYKSSFNKKPEKDVEKKPKKEKPIKEQKPKKKIKVNVPFITLLVFSFLFIVCVMPNNFLKSFILGLFGLTIYGVCVIGIFFSIMFLMKKKFVATKRYIVYLSVALGIIWFIFHLILTSKIPLDNYGIYLKETYLAKTTAGGLVFSLLSYPLVKYLTYVGAYIMCGIALAIFVGLIIDYVNTSKTQALQNKKSKFDFDNIEELNIPEDTPQIAIEKVEEKDNKKLAKQRLGLEKNETTIISSSMPNYEVNLKQAKPMSKREYILTPIDPIIPTETESPFNQTFEQKRVQESNVDLMHHSIKTNAVEITETKPTEQPSEVQIQYSSKIEKINQNDDLFVDEEEIAEYETAFETDTDMESSNTDLEEDENIYEEDISVEDDYEEFEELEDLNEEAEEFEENQAVQVEEITADVTKQDFIDEYAITEDKSDLGSTVATDVVMPSVVDISKFNLPNAIKKPVGEQAEEKPSEPQKLDIPPYIAPPVELLNYIENPSRISDEELQDNIERLEQVLEDFKVPAKVNNVQVGPAVTRYELTMPRGISVNKIAQMSDDIAMTLASNGAIRVEAPIPGKNSVGIEVPNAQVSSVSLRELIDSEQFRQRGNPLSFVLGKDINGDIIFCNLDKMPHVLVAGSTGSGKSVCLNTMLLSMCYKAGPEDLRLILVDPKMVEFSTYSGLPHLLIPEVITNKDMTINALDWSIKEMERRYALFAKTHVVNINEFNKSEAVKSKREQKLPFIVIVVDELADLMLEAKREIEDRISKLAAKARASGIHLVLATQRPSVDVITGTVKTNLPSRIAFALTNYMDSKTVLDGGGAEKLLGKGDMLFKPQDKPEPRRVQGAYVSNPEISAVVQFIKDNNNPVYDENAGRAIKNPRQGNGGGNNDFSGAKETEFDPVLKDALKWFIQMKQASGSMISRRYSVGFNRAGRIMDQMERAGFIGPQEGAKPRQVLITMDEYNAIFGEE